ncbi:N-acetyltransferase [Sphingomonas sp. BT-65]|uniref:GNAT family N-acetyltransferase n=1 Tax=Sphingomonas sp. BT-65 TaxID=2989821 RepID=UPI002235EE69|nr:N-acetyltransferase [Sphingomonas sp. BT-65]MCW4463316.1 N-acetyltransferase [Sphingomonas sp. BT-65]
MFDLVPLADAPAEAVETLLDAAFGADRHGRTAYRVREGMAPIPELSFAALEQSALVGSIQCWPVALACDGGGAVPMVMVGPVAVSPERQNVGIGRALMWKAIRVAEGGGVPGGDALMLVGDPEYYAQFGFDATATGQWRLPGPFEARRLLARGSAVPDRAGMVGPRVQAFTGAIKSA